MSRSVLYALLLIVGLAAPPAWAQNTSGGGGSGTSLSVEEEDGAPAVSGVATLKFPNGSVTDNGGGNVSVTPSGGAPTDATYLMQTANGSTSAEQAIGALATGCMGSTTTTGVVATRTITGTASEIAVANGDCSGNPTLSLPSAVSLAGKALTIPSSTSLPGTCTVGQIYMDTDATTGQRIYACESSNTWVVQGVGGSGAPTDATYIMQTANGSTSAEQALSALATGILKNTTTTGVLSIAAAGTDYVAGTPGTTANAIPRASGTGGTTVKASGCTINDSDMLTCPGGFTAGTSGAGLVTMLEGTVVSAGPNAGEHNVGFDSSDSRLKSRENGGSLVTYALTADKLSAFAATTSAELRGVLNDETGTGAAVFVAGNIGAGTATTASANDNTTLIATTAYVQTELTAYASDTVTFTNKTMDVEGAGNVFTIPRRIWLPAAGCNNATAGNVWDLPTSNPAVPACKTGTNTQMGVMDFADGSNLSAQVTYVLPTTWTGAVDARIKWLTSATSGSVVWQLSTICVADAETDDPAFNTASTVTDAAKGTTLQTNDATITGVTTTGCAAGELMHLKIQRDAAHASDNLAATARLIGVELTIREAL